MCKFYVYCQRINFWFCGSFIICLFPFHYFLFSSLLFPSFCLFWVYLLFFFFPSSQDECFANLSLYSFSTYIQLDVCPQSNLLSCILFIYLKILSFRAALVYNKIERKLEISIYHLPLLAKPHLYQHHSPEWYIFN